MYVNVCISVFWRKDSAFLARNYEWNSVIDNFCRFACKIDFPVSTGHYFIWRLLLYCTNTVYASRYTIENYSLYSRKTGHRSGNQFICLYLSVFCLNYSSSASGITSSARFARTTSKHSFSEFTRPSYLVV